MVRTHRTPKTLKTVWANAARLAFVFPTAAAILAVMVVPIFSPKTMAAAISNFNHPMSRNTRVSATVALDD